MMGPYKCDTCDRGFVTQRASEQHMDVLGHWAPTFKCETCDRVFGSIHACDQHMDARDHWPRFPECPTCEEAFETDADCESHMDSHQHWPYTCEYCYYDSMDKDDMTNHMDHLQHWPYTCDYCHYGSMDKDDIANHMENCEAKPYCSSCDRFFRDQNCLDQHLNSRVHRGANVPCQFCYRDFTTPGGVAHHLESGACEHASLNRDMVYRAARKADYNGTYTHGKRWGKRFHCPEDRCAVDFVSLAALYQHLESGCCGAMFFEDVIDMLDEFFAGGFDG
ncbi:hypothetical protein K490DRAFT_61291 [Saccharata proteae CBS 121410]|uniref:C2H2-type domain-containing protein n=1 Tax=Saccharata proteae CBS 121410 TaxID=1314787 RepID=A0A9P4M3H0_9PEZI|nr:hypothetical protein K490DRAFT_61291 [Saccharata proteae CBS 121410]